MRKNLLLIQEQQNKLIEQRNLTKEIELIVANLDQFSGKIIENLDQLDWCGKRDIIRRIVRRIELGQDDINIVYKIGKLPRNDNDTGANAQHCCNRTSGSEEGFVGVTQQIYSTGTSS